MRTRNFSIGVCLLSLAFLNGCHAATAIPTQTELDSSTQPTVYAYSMLAPGNAGGNVIFARLVFDSPAQVCPSLSGDDGSTLKTTPRPLNPNSTGANINVANFPVTVCEAVMQEGVAYTNGSIGVALKKVTLDAQHVQVYGDSGCKAKDCPGNTPSTHFKALSDYGSRQAVDLILHMGDYNYRGTSAHFATSQSGTEIYAYDAGDVPNPTPSCSYDDPYYSQNSANSPKPDSWTTWQADFFSAANELLPLAPWVFSRGNHELCSRAGPGWFYFLGPGSSLPGAGQPQMQCPNQGDLYAPPSSAANGIQMVPPYMVSLKNYQVWVMDSANACDEFSKTPLTKQYQQQFEQLAKDVKASNDTPTWVMGHRPIWGYQGGSGSINNMLQTALAGTKARELPSAVQLSLAGHMHIYESLTFVRSNGLPTGRPPQIVIGNSGVKLGGAPGKGTQSNIDGQTAQYNSEDQTFGFLQMTVGQNGAWQGPISTASGSAIVQCNSANPSNKLEICQ